MFTDPAADKRSRPSGPFAKNLFNDSILFILSTLILALTFTEGIGGALDGEKSDTAKEKVSSGTREEIFSGDVTFIVQSYNNTGKISKTSYPVATYTTDFYIESIKQWHGRVFFHFESGAGDGLDGEELVLASGANRDAGNSENRLETTEAWYELLLANGKTNITFGKFDPTYFLDQNRFANDETLQFTSCAFRNNQALEFPDNNLGVHVLLSPWKRLELESELVDTGSAMEDIFKKSFVSLQLNIKPFVSERTNIRLYGWLNTARHTPIKEGIETNRRNVGYGLSADFDIHRGAGFFLRYGKQDGKLTAIEHFSSLGLQLEGGLWHRERDLLGAAIALNTLSAAYKELIDSNRNEMHIEIYYNCFALEKLSFSPDIQIIFNPAGFDSHRILVFGLRTQIYL